ncbi:phosphotransferase-like protein [Paenibacillus sp. EC2-1]|uniref:phosphotransferase-like protein n=1 Tax=Paenibacillus sp. EC2-1 TaxID=3388665 RepID=UPI003BEF2183
MNIDFIILHGSSGNGKTTLSRKLHDHLRSPYFEFGWIPEFRSLTPSVQITQRQEEQLFIVEEHKNNIEDGNHIIWIGVAISLALITLGLIVYILVSS